MRILYITPYLPVPPDSGGKIRVYELVRRLARRHELTLATLLDTESDTDHIHTLESLGIRVLAAGRSAVKQDSRAKLTRLLTPTPRLAHEYYSPQLARLVEQTAREMRPDIVHCEQLHTAAYAASQHDAPRILVEQNIEYNLLKQIARLRTSIVSRYAGQVDAFKTQWYERRAWRQFAAYVTMSGVDRTHLLQHRPSGPVYVVPNGVDVATFEPSTRPRPRATLIITGTLGYYPNLDGVCWFLDRVFPQLRRAAPTVDLLLVGQLNQAAAQAIGDQEGVTLTGRVPDVRPYVAQSAVFIVPLRMGSGTRLKVLEAMAQGMPIVSTRVGCEGLDVVDGEHLLVADTADEFAAATLRLLQDEALRHHLGQRARQLVVERYDWDSIVLHLENVYQQAIELARRPKPATNVALRGGQP